MSASPLTGGLEIPDWDAISRIFSSSLHGNLGPAKSKPLHLIQAGSDEDRQKFAEAIRGLLHGDAELADRLENFLAADLPGIGETVAMKLLSIWEPSRVLHIFKVHGQNGKAKLMVLPPVSLGVPQAESTAQLAIKTNDLIRERLAPYLGDDCYGMTRYLYWLAVSLPPKTARKRMRQPPRVWRTWPRTCISMKAGGWRMPLTC